jgi:hypothetical protein
LNPEYVSVLGYKPLFQFYKPQNYRWEIYFMLQKVYLVGFMGMFASSMVCRRPPLTTRTESTPNLHKIYWSYP